MCPRSSPLRFLRVLGIGIACSWLPVALAQADEAALTPSDLQPAPLIWTFDPGGGSGPGILSPILYSATVETGSRYNPSGGAVPDNRRVAFDDVPIPNARLGGATRIEVTKVTVGIRQVAGAPATDVNLYWATATTGPIPPDTELDSPGFLFATASLPAASSSVTRIVTVGNGINPIAGLGDVPLNTTLFSGFSTFLLGVNLSSTNSNNGWRITSGVDANADVFWQYDPFMTGQPNPEGLFFFGGSPVARFYIQIEGNPYGPCCFADGSCAVLTQVACGSAGGAWQGAGASCAPNPCPQPTGACCYADGSCAELTGADCFASGGAYRGDGTSCSPNPCPQPTGACCYADGSCAELTSADCFASGGAYRGDGTSCFPNPCPQPTGACCYASGACAVFPQAECEASGGSWLGPDTFCDPNPCPQPTGACCYGNGSCSVLTAAECSGSGGQYVGDGSSCDPNPCEQPIGACCHTDGTCQGVTEEECLASGGIYGGDGTSCDPNPCPQPTGACCSPDGTCIVLTAMDCAAHGGMYQGDGSDCDPNPCEQPIGACCFHPGGDCQLMTQAACVAAGGSYAGDGVGCNPGLCPPTATDKTTWGRVKSVYR